MSASVLLIVGMIVGIYPFEIGGNAIAGIVFLHF
jgi:hypothetical protein